MSIVLILSGSIDSSNRTVSKSIRIISCSINQNLELQFIVAVT